MRVRFCIHSLLLTMAVAFAPLAVGAQQSCPPPPAPTVKAGANMFNMQQEMDLGDAMAEQFQRQYRVIDDPAVTAYLQQMGDRLAEHLPPGSLKYKFVVYDQPVANAFGTTGGRIYVSRKLIGFVRNEDELAGLLGHEMGHMVAHQTAMVMTLLFQKVLGVTSVSDRQDIFNKYNQLLDTEAKKRDAISTINNREEDNQLIADHLGLYLASVSGYDPQALAQFWDRFAGTKGKTGSSFADLFGFSNPEEHRLRELEDKMATLPKACGAPRTPSSQGDFEAWKAAVLDYSGLGHRESLHGVIFKQELNPPLRGDVKNLRFSPDGKYALAQDDSSIYILTREPFKFIFRIDAPEALPAMFSADSQTVSFHTRGLRIETWSLQDQARTELHDMVVHPGCAQTELSPDGKFLGCVEQLTFGLLAPGILQVEPMALRVYDVSSGDIVFEKKDFGQPTFGSILQVASHDSPYDLRNRLITMHFSPDVRYFVACSRMENALAVELTTRKTIPLPSAMKKFLDREFIFLAPNRILGINSAHTNQSGIVHFPSGELVEEIALGMQSIEAPTRGNYILLRPIDKYPLGVMDLETKKIFMADAEPAFDVFDSIALVTHLNGEIALKQLSTKQESARLTLPRGPLAPLRATALSPDLKWLAVSELSRGGVWDLAKNERPFYVRGFDGAYFAPDGSLFADFPKFQETERSIGQLNVNSRSSAPGYKVEDKHAKQISGLLLVRKPNGKDQSGDTNITLDVRDASSAKTLWTRSFPDEAPGIHVSSYSDTITFMWRLSTSAASNELKADPDLAKRVTPVKREPANYLIEVVDAHTGKSLGGMAIDTNNGSFLIQTGFLAGDHVILTDNLNRVLVYSLSTGQQTAKVFGRAADATAAAGLLVAENEAGQLQVYDLATMEKRDDLMFSSPIAMKQFSGDGKRLFVLTAAQTAYVLDVAQLSSSTAAASGPAQ
jgi:hypothetical protein